MASSSRVITLDPSRQKLLLPPDEPIPRFYPMPQVLMVTPIYDKRELSQGSYDSPSRSLGDYDYRSRDHRKHDDGYASSARSDNRGMYSDSERDDGRRRDAHYGDTRSRRPRRRHDHWWSRHRRDSRDGSRGRSDSDSDDSYMDQRHRDSPDYSRSRAHPRSSHRRPDSEDASSDGGYSSEGPPRHGQPRSARDEYASRSRPNGQYSVPMSGIGHSGPSQSHAPSQSHGHAPSQTHYPPMSGTGHIGLSQSHGSSQSHGHAPSQTHYPPPHGPSSSARDEYASRSRQNGQFSVYPTSDTGHIGPSQSQGPSQSHGHSPSQTHYPPPHGHAPSQNDYLSPHGHAPSQNDYAPSHGHASSHAPSQDNYHPAPNPQQLMAQLGQQAASSYAQHSGTQQKHGFLGGLAQSALGHALSQGSNQPYAQHPASSNGYSQPQPQPHGGRAPPPSDAHSQFFGSDPLAGMHLPPATKALLHYAQREGILDDIAKYFRVLPPAPNFFYSKCTGRKRAVCIGINYIGQKDELHGCANDAENMRDFLIKNYGFKSQDILVLIDDKYSHPGQPRPTRKEMFNAMSWLISDARPHDSLFFHYSGHGGQSPDASGKEKDGMDEVIFPVDYDDNHGDGPGDIIDDELHEALVHNLPPGVRLTALFDSCHSGTLLDLPYLHSAHGRLRSLGHISKRAQQRGTSDPGDVICLAACKDDETSADTREGGVAVGAMSWAFIQALEQNKNQTYDELLQHLRATLIPKYHQKAQISGTHPVDLQRQFTL